MAHPALPAPRRRRVLGGLLDADGWAWAGVKAAFWFVVIILLLGYIPDRAYYFTVQKTVDIGLLAGSPVNFCPPENEGIPCPVPAGATLPWHTAPEKVRLPAGRTDGAGAVIGQVYICGRQRRRAGAQRRRVHLARRGHRQHRHLVRRAGAARGARGCRVRRPRQLALRHRRVRPRRRPHRHRVQPDRRQRRHPARRVGRGGGGQLPEARAGSSAVAVSDGIMLMGGTNGTAATNTVWKSKQATGGGLGEWVPQSPLFEPNVDGVAVHIGDVIFLIGGRNDAEAVVATVQQGLVGGPNAPADDPNAIVAQWRVSAQTNLPGARSDMSGFTANGGIYVQGGNDGTTQSAETYWTIPDADGVIGGWKNLDQTDLGQGIEGSAAVVSGSHAFLIAGLTPQGVTNDIARTNLAPQEPFFQLGLLGATVPALKLDGEIGQQIGYLNAAGVGTVNFILLILIGYLYNHPAKAQALWARIRRKR